MDLNEILEFIFCSKSLHQSLFLHSWMQFIDYHYLIFSLCNTYQIYGLLKIEHLLSSYSLFCTISIIIFKEKGIWRLSISRLIIDLNCSSRIECIIAQKITVVRLIVCWVIFKDYSSTIFRCNVGVKCTIRRVGVHRIKFSTHCTTVGCYITLKETFRRAAIDWWVLNMYHATFLFSLILLEPTIWRIFVRRLKLNMHCSTRNSSPVFRKHTIRWQWISWRFRN
jgi:hypothetical protein